MRIDTDLAYRLEAGAAQSIAVWWERLAPRPDLGLAPAVTARSGVTCTRGPQHGLSHFNRAMGLGFQQPVTAENLLQMQDFFKPVSVWYADVCPYASRSGQLMGMLQDAGFRAAGYECELAARPDQMEPPASLPGVEVVPVTDDNFAAYAAVENATMGVPPELREAINYASRGLMGRDDVALYMALVEGTPAAFGILTVGPEGTAHLGGGGTLPEFRGRGLQTMLIRLRAQEAARRGCDLLGGSCSAGSQSHWNMEANGFRLAYTKTLWGHRAG